MLPSLKVFAPFRPDPRCILALAERLQGLGRPRVRRTKSMAGAAASWSNGRWSTVLMTAPVGIIAAHHTLPG